MCVLGSWYMYSTMQLHIVLVWWLYTSSQQAIFEEGNSSYCDFSEVCCVY